MSDLGIIIKGKDLSAPTGMFRLARIEDEGTTKQLHWLVNDYPRARKALEEWRHYRHFNRNKPNRSYIVWDDEGREVGIHGVLITEAERIASKDKFRVVFVDLACGRHGESYSVWLVADMDDRDKAIEDAKALAECTDLHSGYQVHDDTGKKLLRRDG